MKDETELMYEREKYRRENKITGDCIILKFITNNKTEQQSNNEYRIDHVKNKLRPIGLCLYTNKKYHLLCCPMTWSLDFITDDLEYFEEETKDNWSGEKGKLKNKNCWYVLNKIQEDMSFQSWCEIFPEILNIDMNRKS